MLSGKLSLAAFAEWLASESWNMFADGSNYEAVALVAAIHIRIDAYDDGVLDPASFRREIASLLNNVSESIKGDVGHIVAPREPPGELSATKVHVIPIHLGLLPV